MPRARSGVAPAVVFQVEVRGFAFAIAFLFGFIALGFFERLLDFGIGAQAFGALPFRDGLVDFVGAVVGPAHQLRHVGGIGRRRGGRVPVDRAPR